MSLEQQIKELQRLLALKTAYSKVLITFDESDAIPADVKDEVIAKLSEVAVALGEGIESPKPSSAQATFSEDEIEILKTLISSVKDRAVAKNGAANAGPTLAPSTPQKPAGPKMAMIMRTDDLPKEAKKVFNSNELVKILNINEEENKALVANAMGHRTIISLEDIELQ